MFSLSAFAKWQNVTVKKKKGCEAENVRCAVIGFAGLFVSL